MGYQDNTKLNVASNESILRLLVKFDDVFWKSYNDMKQMCQDIPIIPDLSPF